MGSQILRAWVNLIRIWLFYAKCVTAMRHNYAHNYLLSLPFLDDSFKSNYVYLPGPSNAVKVLQNSRAAKPTAVFFLPVCF